jgi:ABC-2 type transport system ATP-binding protein
MNEPAIWIDQLSKSYGEQQVLQKVSLSVPSGQTLALLGRNGAGKTTTIRILLGLIPADSGTVRLGGIDPTVDPLAVRRQVGYLAEDQMMYGWMTPIELCRFLAPFYPNWDQTWARDNLDRFEIPRNVRIGRLSKGQSVKLGLVVALAHRPPIVILDDPAMGLDPISRKEFNRDLVEHLQSSGCTVLYSSHLLDEVEAVADAVAILDQGRIVRASATEQLRDEVKQILLPAASVAGTPQPVGLLDVCRHEERLALITDHAGSYVEQLEDRGIEHDVIDLSLDEIFEAFVIGRKQDWPGAPGKASAVSLR